MSTLDQVIDLQITVQSSAVSLPSRTIALVLAPASEVPAAWTTGRVRTYTDDTSVLTDGFLSSSQTYKEVQAILSQSPHPDKVRIGRRLTAVAMVQDIAITAANTTHYIVEIFDGYRTESFDYLSDGTATVTEIRDGIIALINASATIGVTASISVNDVRLTADNAGIPFTTTETSANMTVTTSTANVGIPEDLAAIIDEQPDWYALDITQRDNYSIAVAAAQVEALERAMFAQSGDSAIISAVYNSSTPNTDIHSYLKSKGYHRTVAFYEPDAADTLAAAAIGRYFSEVPGSATMKFESLVGVSPTQLTATQLTNLLSKNGNGYRELGGFSMVYEGTAASGRFFDLTHGNDDLKAIAQINMVGILRKGPKVPMTQNGLNALGGGLRTALRQKTRDGLVADSRVNALGETEAPAFTVTMPNIQDVPAAARELREITSASPFKFEYTAAGAVHKAAVRGTVSFV